MERWIFRNGKVGQPLAAPPLYGCRIPLAGEGGARDYARRRVSERNRRKAALSAEMTQEGETGEAPPVADEASLFRGRLPFFGRLAPGKRLGRQRISSLLKSTIFRTFIKF